jgi:hypothetical protein
MTDDALARFLALDDALRAEKPDESVGDLMNFRFCPPGGCPPLPDLSGVTPEEWARFFEEVY